MRGLTREMLILTIQRSANVKRKRKNLRGKTSRLKSVSRRRKQQLGGRGLGMRKGLIPQEGSSNLLNFSMEYKIFNVQTTVDSGTPHEEEPESGSICERDEGVHYSRASEQNACR